MRTLELPEAFVLRLHIRRLQIIIIIVNHWHLHVVQSRHQETVSGGRDAARCGEECPTLAVQPKPR